MPTSSSSIACNKYAHMLGKTVHIYHSIYRDHMNKYENFGNLTICKFDKQFSLIPRICRLDHYFYGGGKYVTLTADYNRLQMTLKYVLVL